MKKVFLTLIAMLLVKPVVAFAANKVHVVIPNDNDSNIKEVPNEETGVVVKSFPIYVTQTEATEIKSVTVTITKKAEAITNVAFTGNEPYKATKDGLSGTFAVDSGVTGASGTKVLIGYVEVTENTASDDCSSTYTAKVNGVKTGAYVSYIALGAGVLLVYGIYTATRSKKKMYNI